MNNLCKSFGRAPVLRDISFAVADGEFCALLGPSGCGKSTLLRIIAGLETASSGSIRLDDRPIDGLAPRERDLAFVFQNYALYPHMTVSDNLGFALKMRGMAKDERRSRVSDVARLLELDGHLNKRPQQLSGGQRQRVALGRAIVRRPRLFLFDEPLSNLDAALRANMRLELARLHQRLGTTMIYVTHDQAEAMTLGDKVIVFHEGKIQQAGRPSEIYARPANLFVAGFVGASRMNLLEGTLRSDAKIFQSGALSLDLSKIAAALPAIAAAKGATLGFRAEAVKLCTPGEAVLHGIVEFVDELGADRLLHIDCSGVHLIARIGVEEPVKKKQMLSLTIARSDLHWFVDGVRCNDASG